jgi:hypothetical protein
MVVVRVVGGRLGSDFRGHGEGMMVQSDPSECSGSTQLVECPGGASAACCLYDP